MILKNYSYNDLISDFNVYICSMRFWSIIILPYFLFLCMTPCTKQFLSKEKVSCCSKSTTNEPVHNGTDDGNAHNECAGCNPLNSCHCCSVFVSYTQSLEITCLSQYQAKNTTYSEFIPSSIVFSIWQPPKIS